MSCEHKRLKSVNCVLYCADCGARVDKPASKMPDKPIEKPAKKPIRKGASTK